MDRIKKESCHWSQHEGYLLGRAFGANTPIPTDDKAQMGYLRVASEYGQMPPRNHPPAIFYVEAAKSALISSGKAPDALDQMRRLQTGEYLCVGGEDWYQIHLAQPDGFADLVWFTVAPDVF